MAIVLNNTLDCAPEIPHLTAANAWHRLEVRVVLFYKSDRVAGERPLLCDWLESRKLRTERVLIEHSNGSHDEDGHQAEFHVG